MKALLVECILMQLPGWRIVKKMGAGVQPASEALSLIDTSFLWNSKNILLDGAAHIYIGDYLPVQVLL